jgi:hypothetical protein
MPLYKLSDIVLNDYESSLNICVNLAGSIQGGYDLTYYRIYTKSFTFLKRFGKNLNPSEFSKKVTNNNTSASNNP